MEINADLLQKYLKELHVSRIEMIERMLLSDKSCGILEVWDYGTYMTGNKILVTYELDESIPYGEIHSIVRR